MLQKLFYFLTNTLILLGLGSVLPGFTVKGFGPAAIFILVLTILNWTILPIIKILTLPITILTLGFFNTILNLLVITLLVKIIPGMTLTGTNLNQFLAIVVISITLAIQSSLVNDSQNN